VSGILREGSVLAGPSPLADTPGRYRFLLLPLLLLIIGGLLAWRLWPEPTPPAAAASPPTQLKDRVLTGARGPSCIRLVVGLDVSGSMREFATARDTALAQLITWSKKYLRPDDELAVVDFAADAAVRTPPTTRDRLSGVGVEAGANDGRYTNLEPALSAVDGFRTGRCDTELVLISDAQLADLPLTPADGKELQLRHRIHDVRLLVPGDNVDVPQAWTLGFPEAPPARFDGTDPDATAIAFGQAIAGFTGQSLK
jgi:von Willebrand factor type A domain